FTQPFLQFVEIQIVPSTGVADNNYRFGLHAPSRYRPEVLVVIQRGSVTNRAAVKFPGRRGGDNDQHNNNSDAAPRNLRNRALELKRWTAIYALRLRRLAEKQTRQLKYALKIGSR